MIGAGAGTALVLVLDAEVEVVAVSAGGDAVSEQDAMTRQQADATTACRYLDGQRLVACPQAARIKTPVKFV